MLQSTILLALSGLGLAADLNGFKRHKASPKNLLPAAVNSLRVNFGLQDTCYTFQEECDSFWCIPTGGECCGFGDGSYCEIGRYCMELGCCAIGDVCTIGPDEDDTSGSTGCDSAEVLCDGYCIPNDGVCCGDGWYCDAGETCTDDGFCDIGSGSDDPPIDDTGSCYSFQDECDGFCIPSGSVCCGGGFYCLSGETCTDDGFCDDGSSDSTDDEPEGCDLTQDECDAFCIPSGSVCCGDGYYCNAGETCTDDGFCDPGLSGGDPDDDDDDSSSDDTTNTYTLRPIPTGIDVGDDDDETTTEEETTTVTREASGTETETVTETTAEETSTTTETSASSTESVTDGGGEGAGSLLEPSYLFGLLALIPFAL